MKNLLFILLVLLCKISLSQTYDVYQIVSFENNVSKSKTAVESQIIISVSENKIIDRMEGLEDNIYKINKIVTNDSKTTYYCENENGYDVRIEVDSFYKYIKFILSANILLNKEGNHLKYYFH
jgi:predicted methyltransferase